MKRIHYFLIFLLLVAIILGLVYFLTKQWQKARTEQHQPPAAPTDMPVQMDTATADSAAALSGTSTTTGTTTASINYLYAHHPHEHAPFGLPMDNDTTDDFLIFRPQYVASYCPNKNSPNWVAWELNHTWVGPVGRYSGRFLTEPLLPDTFTAIQHNHYTNSGYDRGHLLRSKERTATKADNISTFYLSNVVPQTPDLNRGVWLQFEDYYLNRMQQGNYNVYVISGGTYHTNSTLRNEGLVAIPDSCFKIVVFTPADKSPQRLHINDIETIAVMMPNTQGVRRDAWKMYVTTVENIEAQTGYQFMLRAPDSLQAPLRGAIAH
jgi:endonuclease G, mitochondrial